MSATVPDNYMDVPVTLDYADVLTLDHQLSMLANLLEADAKNAHTDGYRETLQEEAAEARRIQGIVLDARAAWAADDPDAD